ncbi:MAG: hypothetical protein NTW48_07170 [Chloroflexi bacterium]|nr:hypothetical protein [Chloroflexota bacterium]
MWRSKKFIIVAVLAAVILTGSISGVVLAADNGDNNQPGAKNEALLDKVCAIYEQNTGTTIDAQALKEAFTQAQDEMRTEALDEYLQKLVDEGKITQEQADQYKAWLETRPDVPILAPGFPGAGMPHGFGGPGDGFPGRGEPSTEE